jgi:hypothetical protein
MLFFEIITLSYFVIEDFSMRRKRSNSKHVNVTTILFMHEKPLKSIDKLIILKILIVAEPS